MKTNVIQFRLKPQAPPAQVTAAHDTVEHMRQTMYNLPSTEARMEYCLVIIAQIGMWVTKSGHYEDPKAKLLSWIDKKMSQYTKQQKEG